MAALGPPATDEESRRLGRAAVMAMLAAARSSPGAVLDSTFYPVLHPPPPRGLAGRARRGSLPVPPGACAGALPRPQRDAARRPSRRRTAVRGAVERAPPDAARPRPDDRGRHRRNRRPRAPRAGNTGTRGGPPRVRSGRPACCEPAGGRSRTQATSHTVVSAGTRPSSVSGPLEMRTSMPWGAGTGSPERLTMHVNPGSRVKESAPMGASSHRIVPSPSAGRPRRM